MKKLAFAFFVVCLSFSSLTSAQTSASAQAAQNPKTIAVSDIHAGMRGVAYTVFEGVKPEAMEVEVLGVLHNVNGPKGDIILVRLHGQKVEYTGVVAGMSGSPVYLDGKLAGALAFRIGEFSKEPIAGVTPIADMLEISALDRSPAEETSSARPAVNTVAGKTSGPGEIPALPGFAQDVTQSANKSSGKDFANYLKPIETPLVFNGFSEQAIQLFAGQFASAGIVPVMGAGSTSNDKQPEPMVAGSAVSAILVRGDMDIEATCTVTYVDPQRLLACGHPLLQFGSVDLPMNKAEVLATLASPLNAFKIVNTTEPVGTFVQDRHTGIMGVFDRQPEMIPVTLSIHSNTGVKQFHYEVLNNPKLTPVALMVTVFNALHGVNEFGEEITYRLAGSIGVKGFPDVTMRNMFAPGENSQPAAMQAAIALGERFGRIYDNPYNAPAIAGVNLDFDLVRERRWARLESARTDVTEARPGEEIMLETVLAPYRGERIVQQIPVKIPTSASKGTLRILVSDGDTLDRIGHSNPAFGRKLDLASTIAVLNKEHSNNRVYVSLLEADPEARVADKVMPTLPISIMNVMDGMRGNQEMVVSGESSVDETATAPLDYVVSGAQLLTVTVK